MSQPSPNAAILDLQERLHRLEKRRVGVQIWLLAGLLGVVGLASMGMVNQDPDVGETVHPDVLRAGEVVTSRLLLLSPEGKTVGTLSGGSGSFLGGGPFLSLSRDEADPEKNTYLFLNVDRFGAGIHGKVEIEGRGLSAFELTCLRGLNFDDHFEDGSSLHFHVGSAAPDLGGLFRRSWDAEAQMKEISGRLEEVEKAMGRDFLSTMWSHQGETLSSRLTLLTDRVSRLERGD